MISVSRSFHLPIAAFVLAVSAIAWHGDTDASNLERGEALYENHCRECHESNVHIRSKSKVRSLTNLRGQVARWSIEINQGWSSEEIGDVSEFLNDRYYHYPPR